mmetsp:Transcript_46339/g.117348  ORF Transcript_46339/g.117348 Transcript_46339/m.117348 type:complete len:306 (+) Transcript_46339:196-1113(+)
MKNSDNRLGRKPARQQVVMRMTARVPRRRHHRSRIDTREHLYMLSWSSGRMRRRSSTPASVMPTSRYSSRLARCLQKLATSPSPTSVTLEHQPSCKADRLGAPHRYRMPSSVIGPIDLMSRVLRCADRAMAARPASLMRRQCATCSVSSPGLLRTTAATVLSPMFGHCRRLRYVSDRRAEHSASPPESDTRGSDSSLRLRRDDSPDREVTPVSVTPAQPDSASDRSVVRRDTCRHRAASEILITATRLRCWMAVQPSSAARPAGVRSTECDMSAWRSLARACSGSRPSSTIHRQRLLSSLVRLVA